MLILGIANNDTAGACLVKNSIILSAVHEERFTRIKGDKTWPQQSIDFVLKSNNIKMNDIDVIAYGWKAGFNEDNCLNIYVSRIIHESTTNLKNIEIIKKRIADELINDQEKRKEFDDYILKNKMKDRVRLIDHHDTHAWGAWLCSPWNDALVVTCDGRGDFLSLTIRRITNGEELVLQRETTIDSLGYFYGRITHLLGFTPNRHEGKITGLAAHGNPKTALPLIKKMIDIHNNRLLSNCGDYYIPSYQGYSDKLINEIKIYSPQDIAAAAQFHLENIITSLIKHHMNNKKSHICLAGGIFGNVRLNQTVREIPGVDNVFILPCMGDEGLPLAAAVTAAWRERKTRCQFNTMNLGPEIDNEEIKIIMESSTDLICIKPVDMIDYIIKLLKDDKIIALVRGKMEFGPRALCHRSIIYHANNPDINAWLNAKLGRTEFMPFAPVTTEKLVEICFKNWEKEDISAEFMTITYSCNEIMKDQCPAVVHIDNTARPQIVKESKDPFIFRLINKWHDISGQPCLVNTSFNRHEEPIIDTLRQAVPVLKEKTIDVIIINDCYALIRREDV